MPRFVVLFHETPPGSERPAHWDLMLESAGTLLTWALAAAPQPGKKISAEALPDHRLSYLDYEGPVSRDRGQVSRWDAGHYTLQQESDGELIFQLSGDKLQCVATLTRDAVVGVRWSLKLE